MCLEFNCNYIPRKCFFYFCVFVFTIAQKIDIITKQSSGDVRCLCCAGNMFRSSMVSLF